MCGSCLKYKYNKPTIKINFSGNQRKLNGQSISFYLKIINSSE